MALGSAHQSHSHYLPQQPAGVLASQQQLRQLAAMPYSKPGLASAYQPQTLANGGQSVVRRNARERNRVKQVNNGFSNLRQHIPVAIIADLSNGRRGIGPGANKKLSKVSTLRMAVEYIRRLQRLIDENDGQAQPQQQQQLLYQQQQQQQQLYALQQQLQLSSPTGSSSSLDSSSSNSNSSSSSSSSSSSFGQQLQQLQQPMAYYGLKMEDASYDDYRQHSCSSGAEDDEILDYISLWQDDL